MTAAQLIAEYVDGLMHHASAYAPRLPDTGIVLAQCYLCAGRGSYRARGGYEHRCANCAGKGTILEETEA